jgi:hypothetical protein
MSTILTEVMTQDEFDNVSTDYKSNVYRMPDPYHQSPSGWLLIDKRGSGNINTAIRSWIVINQPSWLDKLIDYISGSRR